MPQDIETIYKRASVELPALYILDQHLTATLKGTHVLKRLRAAGIKEPVIFLSGEKDPNLPAETLDLSADDFVHKPFTPAEMMARIRAVMRRAARSVDPRIRGDTRVSDDDFPFAGCMLSPATMQASNAGGKRANLKPYSMAVAHALFRRKGSIVTRAELLTSIWGIDDPKKRTLDTTIYELKRTLGRLGGDPDCVESVKAVGYRYNPPVVKGVSPRKSA